MFLTDIKGLCRVCLNDSHFYSHVYNQKLREECLYIVLNDVCQLNVKKGDGLPQYVCGECYKRISQFDSFKRLSHEGNATLQRMKCDLESHTFRLEEDTVDYSETFPVEPEVEITVETEKTLYFEENSSDDGDQRDSQVSNSPVHLDKSASGVGRSKGVVKSSKAQNGIKKKTQQKGKGKKGTSKANTRSSKIVKPDNVALKDKRTQSVRTGRIEKSTCKKISSSTSKCNKRKQKTVKSEDVEKDCASVSTKEDDLKGKSDSIEKGKKKVKKSVGKDKCKCDDCGDEFDNKLDMLYHTKTHYGVRGNGCKLGNSLKVAGKKLREGKKVSEDDDEKVDNQRSYKCKVCKKMFYQIRHLKLHQMIHTGNRQFKCKSCEKEFLYLGHLKVHERLHTGEKSFKCKVCKKGFYNSSNLRVHERVHTGEKLFKCKLCNKDFSHSNRLRDHEKIHDDEKVKIIKEQFKCDLCGKEFYQKGNLKMHEKWHSREKTFPCNLCKKEFTEMRHLKRHEVVHTREKPFKCDVCDKGFSYSYNVQVHKKVHKGST